MTNNFRKKLITMKNCDQIDIYALIFIFYVSKCFCSINTTVFAMILRVCLCIENESIGGYSSILFVL